MSRTKNTAKRRTVNRSPNEPYDFQFDGERFGNQRKQVAELKKRARRTDRARTSRAVEKDQG